MRFLPLLLALLCSTHLTAQDPTNTTRRIYLSGTDAEHTRTWDFYCSGGQQSGKWRTIEVPSCWELQGYGEYTYGRFYKTKGLEPSTETGRALRASPTTSASSPATKASTSASSSTLRLAQKRDDGLHLRA